MGFADLGPKYLLPGQPDKPRDALEPMNAEPFRVPGLGFRFRVSGLGFRA